jgi:gluconokinase
LSTFFMGIDIGTSAVKVLVVDEEGKQISQKSAKCQIHQPKPDYQEQDLEEVWISVIRAVRNSVEKIDSGKIKAISFSSAMHGMIVIGKNGRPLTRQMTWADGRSRKQAKNLSSEHDGNDIFNRTGCPATALYHPARIMWLKENEPEIFKKAFTFASIKDAIVQRLTGRWVTDKSHASSNGLLDIKSLEWDQKILEILELDKKSFPELVPPEETVGKLLVKPAEELGLHPGIMIVPGAGDGGLANLGSGAVDPGQAVITIGTSGAMRKISSKPLLDPKRKIWCYYLADKRWYIGGAINSGGIIMRWLRDNLMSDDLDSYEKIMALAQKAKPGADGLMFLPYLYGERTPYWNPAARGVMFGLAPHHGKPHIARSAIEGICMCMAHLQELIEDSSGDIYEIRATGGFTHSEIWLQMMADILGHEISLPSVKESSAMGAAILGMKAYGAIDDLSAVKKMTPVDRVFEPDPDLENFYHDRFMLFKNLYKHLESDFETLAQLEKEK